LAVNLKKKYLFFPGISINVSSDYFGNNKGALIFIIICFSLLIIRVGYLQVVKGIYYRELSENNRLRFTEIIPYRGRILDCDKKVLVDNRPSFNLIVIKEDCKDIKNKLEKVSKLLNIPLVSLENIVKDANQKGMPGFAQITLVSDLTWEQVALFENYRYDFAGLSIIVESKRNYHPDGFASHLIGYLGEIEERELKSNLFKDIKKGEIVGKTGLEKEFDEELRGIKGLQQKEVNSVGRVIKVLHTIPPKSGKNLILTINSKLQAIANKELTDKAGAIVAIDPRDGALLAFASAPSFSQNFFICGFNSKAWNSLLCDPLKPLQNKVTQGQYPPGSTFKVITAMAGFYAGLISAEEYINCPGFVYVGRHKSRCWRRYGHGPVNFHKSLVESCDVYYYQLGLKMGVDHLSRISRMFGFGDKTGFGLQPESKGLVPSSEWKMARYGVPWQKGETVSVAIGQGFLLVTPLQLAVAYAAIANGGKIYMPYVVNSIQDIEGQIVSSKPRLKRILKFPENAREHILKGLSGVVNESHGTGWACRLKDINVGGKTGTAQVIRLLEKYDGKKEEDVPYKYRDHAWFVAMAPIENPEIVIVVLVEHGSHGASFAYIAREMLKAYFVKGS